MLILVLILSVGKSGCANGWITSIERFDAPLALLLLNNFILMTISLSLFLFDTQVVAVLPLFILKVPDISLHLKFADGRHWHYSSMFEHTFTFLLKIRTLSFIWRSYWRLCRWRRDNFLRGNVGSLTQLILIV